MVREARLREIDGYQLIFLALLAQELAHRAGLYGNHCEKREMLSEIP